MSDSWITRHPDWYAQERDLLARHYPLLRIDERALAAGVLILIGPITVRPPGGAKNFPVLIRYPAGSPYQHPAVFPLTALPVWPEDAPSPTTEPDVSYLSQRHQMPDGHLCLFQADTTTIGGDALSILDVIRRVEQWFMGLSTGQWPPDTADSELHTHFLPAGSVLLANAFYQPELGSKGRFFLLPDMHRVLVDRFHGNKAHAPYLVVAMSNEDGLIRSFDARKDLSRLYPWIGDDKWNAATSMAKPSYDPNDREAVMHGYWWALPAEPQPFRDGKGLLEALGPAAGEGGAWKMLQAALGSDLAAPYFYFGLRYPARSGGFEWLILWAPGIQKRDGGALLVVPEHQQRQAFEAAQIYSLRVSRLDQMTLRLRNQGTVDASVPAKCVALIGLGALGSEVAVLLAKAGVGKFRLWDAEVLEPGNAIRHVGGVTDFGAPKVDVIKKRLLAINPYLIFDEGDRVFDAVGHDFAKLEAFMRPADLVVCTTANESAEAFVNECAVLHGKTVVYGRSLREASLGRVFVVKPGHDACKACLAGYIGAKRTGAAVPDTVVDIPEDDNKPLLHECGRPVIAGSAIDLAFVSTLTARVTLDVLEQKDSKTNHWIWVGRSTPAIDRRLTPDLSTVAVHVPRDPTCPICQEPQVRQLVLPPDVRGAIIKEAASSTDRETGGILIGYVKEGTAHVLRATGPGPKAVRSAAIFRRDVEYVQGELDRASSELGTEAVYIGEWHSHLSTDTRPSSTDIDSLVGIARAPNYLTRCPVMIIAGLNVPAAKVDHLAGYAFPISSRVYSIPINKQA